ncbi:Membrane protein involved in the export of O-antigen and teichoic acid [Chitinophaga terrae (ex Kim and Jung 2007)]|uniref:Membrane protein involved in the export of O-antigen and teichoic acid n=1 Tax=Chitinophaga terrae (ex Kim and Jung 2007) TaxID=408074 RepID=A0A1H4GL61_9BACT|nr:oligosaccharide flippase family protein [Chitinophaga terrae (ex Kim and Jung 2007)]SEB09598.1 Membrane protein involved in the export of O-antigen and teichoic acid [Chitinophaga terrae (ex Kim and Jung 2007)]
MGVVKYQSIRSSILIYLGFAIGAVNMFVFPHFFSGDQFGLTRMLGDIGVIMVPFCTFSTGPMLNKFFPYYAGHLPEKKNDLLAWVFLISVIGFLLFVAGTFIFKGLIIKAYIEKSKLFIDYFYLLYPYVFGMVMYAVFENYSWSRHQSVVSNSIKELGIRIMTSVLLVLYILKWISFDVFMWAFSLLYIAGVIALIIYLQRKHLFFLNFSISSVTRRFGKRMATFSLSIMFASVFIIVANNIDGIFISSLKGLDQAGYLMIATYMGMMIQVPQRSIASIATPVMAQAWKDKNMEKIDEIYKKSSILQLIVGLFILLVIWLNIDNIYHFMPPAYASAKYVVLYLGIAKVIDMGTGANQQLLSTSRLWRFELTSAMVLVCMSIPLNYFLIREYGAVGSGYSNLISMFTFNTIRYIFIWKRFGLQPFSFNTLKAILIGLAAYFLCRLLPEINNVFVSIFVKGSCFTVLYASGIMLFRVSDDVYYTSLSILNKAKNIILKK